MDPKKSPASPSAAVAKLRIAGAWAGALEVELEEWTLPMLRAEVARRSGGSPDCINLICGGKVLKDCEEVRSLSQLGLKNNSKVLASVVSPDRGKALNDEAAAEAERSKKLTRIRLDFSFASFVHHLRDSCRFWLLYWWGWQVDA